MPGAVRQPSPLTCPRCAGPLLAGWCVVHGEASPPLAEDLIARFKEETDPPEPHALWTEREIEFAMAARGVLSGPQIAEVLGRSPKAVRQWFSRQRIPLARLPGRRVAPKRRDGLRWTPAELVDLEARDLRGLIPFRSRRAIQSQASRVGAPIYADGRLSLRAAAAEFGVNYKVVRAWVQRGLVPASRVGNSLRIDPEDPRVKAAVPILARLSASQRGRRGWWKELTQ